jgi:hypothetical protein
MARHTIDQQAERGYRARGRVALGVTLGILVLATGGAALANGGVKGSASGYGYGYGYGYGGAPTVTTGAASSVMSMSATLNAIVNPEGEQLTGCYFEYWTGNRLRRRSPCESGPGPVGSPVAVSATVGGLEADTTYDFTIVATNAEGTSRGSERTFTTLTTAPTVTSVAPDAGLEFGWTMVTIRGTGFASATVVRFGANSAVYLKVNSPTSITALSPVGTGTVNVTVANPGGTSATDVADHFTYVPAGHGPSITRLAPRRGPAAGGTAVAISGTGFAGVTAVAFGSSKAAAFTANSSSSISAVSPAEAPGSVEVTVTTPNGTTPLSGRDRFKFKRSKK